MEAAIERLYATFACYRRPAIVDGCPCCVSAVDQTRLHARPLRELDDAELRRYAFKCLTTWGTVNDLRHFLPRILELVAAGALTVDPQVVFGKLEYGEWERWPEVEREAILGFLDAWFEQHLETGERLDEVLSSIHRTGLALVPWLARVEHQALESTTARHALLVLARELATRRSLDAWIGIDVSDDIARWLAHDERLALIVQAIDHLEDRTERGHAYADLDALLMRAGA